MLLMTTDQTQRPDRSRHASVGVADSTDATSPVSWEAVYKTHAVALTRFATFLVGASNANDLVSSALIKTMSRSAQPDDPFAYLLRVMTNLAKSQATSERRRFARELRVADHGNAPTAEPDYEVRIAVRRLSIRQRSVVYLMYWDDLTIPVIAQRLAISEGSVRRHLDRAKRTLRLGLRDETANDESPTEIRTTAKLTKGR